MNTERQIELRRDLALMAFYALGTQLTTSLVFLVLPNTPWRMRMFFAAVGVTCTLLLLWILRISATRVIDVVNRYYEEDQAECERREEEIYEDIGRVAVLYLRQYLWGVKVRDWIVDELEASPHPGLVLEYVRPALHFLAWNVYHAELDKNVFQYKILRDPKGHPATEEDKARLKALDLNFEMANRAFWDIRDGLAATQHPSLIWVKSEVKTWGDALDLPYKVN